MAPTSGGISQAPAASRDERGRCYGTIVVVGGGCYGSYYVRQLTRAAAAGALSWERLVVVDRDPACRLAQARDAARGGAPPQREDAKDVGVAPHLLAAVDIEMSEWSAFFERYLTRASQDPASAAADAIVPSPLMPHLMYEWLLGRARERAVGRVVRTLPLAQAPATPWQRAADDGGHFVSFAEWMCPINCVEPARCPETRGPRSWSMPVAIGDYVREQAAAGQGIDGPLLMRCLHRAYGVGMFDTAEVLSAERALREVVERGSTARVLVGTVSHCHGALHLLEIGAD